MLNLKRALSLLPCGQNFILGKAAARAQDDFLWGINVFLSLEYSLQSRPINEDFSYLNTWKVVRIISFSQTFHLEGKSQLYKGQREKSGVNSDLELFM